MNRPVADASDGLAASGRPGAVALSHQGSGSAPVVVAKGYGAVAESIMREARAHGLYVHSSPDLVKLLMQVDLDRQIPPALCRAVAEVMVWLHGLDSDVPGASPRLP